MCCARTPRTHRAFVDVVAKMHDEVDVLLRHVLIRSEVARLIVLAGSKRER